MGRLLALLAFSFLLINHPLAGQAETTTPETCQLCVESWLKFLKDNYHRLEEGFVFYRWSEAKIRRIYYEDLWLARHHTLDPLSAEARERGKADEVILEKIIRNLESESQNGANRFYHLLTEIESYYNEAGSCCNRSDYDACIQERYEPVLALIAKIRQEFDHIYEREREVRDDIVQAVAGPLGLYREEALEISDAHQDIYLKFEEEREPQRYQENRTMMKLFLEFDRYVHLENKFAGCCLYC